MAQIEGSDDINRTGWSDVSASASKASVSMNSAAAAKAKPKAKTAAKSPAATSSDSFVIKDDSLSWDSLSKKAETEYNSMYDSSLDALKTQSGFTDEEKEKIYAAAVSDNYAGSDIKGLSNMGNVKVHWSDGTDIDWSEMQTLKKTKLSDGEFRASDSSGTDFDDFGKDAKKGDTKKVCGGTITYEGEGKLFSEVDVDDSSLFKSSDYVAVTDDQRGTVVHYDGVLGSFDYNTREFELAYYETKQDGQTVSVPCLKYIGDGKTSFIGESLTGDAGGVGVTDGSKITIPEGLKCADYMFAGSSITSMPVLPSTLESAHGMFMGCKSMTCACDKALDETGGIKMPSGLKDISWMFADSYQMTDFFGNLGTSVLDARCAAQGCENLGYEVEDDGSINQSKFNFKVPNMSNLRYISSAYIKDIFDGSNTDVTKSVNSWVLENKGKLSNWTDDTGSHNNKYDKLVDGTWNPDLETMVLNSSNRQDILQLIDSNAQAISGVSADTDGMMTSAVQLTDGGAFADSSIWAKYRQTDTSGSYTEGNAIGEFLDHGLAFGGEYAVSKGILSTITGGHFKGLTTLGALGIAAVPQFVGFGNKLTPLIDFTAGVVGKDSKFGKFLEGMSDKLKNKDIDWSTDVKNLNMDDTFESAQKSSVNYAEDQITKAMSMGDDSIISAEFDISAAMKANGTAIGKDANLLFIACEPESDIRSDFSDTVMTTTLKSVTDSMDAEVKAAGGMTDAIREKYSGYFCTMAANIDAYDNAAEKQISATYLHDEKLKDMAQTGLEKEMRSTASPLYSTMNEVASKYPGFFTDQQINDTLSKYDIQGIGTYKDYASAKGSGVSDPASAKAASSDSDRYVSELKADRDTLTSSLKTAASQDDIDKAYSSYYESAYGWFMDEAEAHGIVLDKRGAQTTSEKSSFAAQTALDEADASSRISKASGDGSSKYVSSDTVSSGSSSADRRASEAEAVAGISQDDAGETDSLEK